jgi:hypothetical protein
VGDASPLIESFSERAEVSEDDRGRKDTVMNLINREVSRNEE